MASLSASRMGARTPAGLHPTVLRAFFRCKHTSAQPKTKAAEPSSLPWQRASLPGACPRCEGCGWVASHRADVPSAPRAQGDHPERRARGEGSAQANPGSSPAPTRTPHEPAACWSLTRREPSREHSLLHRLARQLHLLLPLRSSCGTWEQPPRTASPAECNLPNERGCLSDISNHSPPYCGVVRAAARLRWASSPRRRHPPILCQSRVEHSPGWRTCSPVASSPALAPLHGPLPSSAPLPVPLSEPYSLGSHDVIRWKSAMLRDWNNPALTRAGCAGGDGHRTTRSSQSLACPG